MKKKPRPKKRTMFTGRALWHEREYLATTAYGVPLVEWGQRKIEAIDGPFKYVRVSLVVELEKEPS